MADFEPQPHHPYIPRDDAPAASASTSPSPTDFAALFPDCTPMHLPPSAVDTCDERFEFWDAATETAWVAEGPSPYHERASRRLDALVNRIAAERGSPIECYGTMALALPDAHGAPRRILRADEALYVHPGRAHLPGPKAMVVGEHDFPDVVLEVDHTTDVRRGKLGLYEAWGFPEVWVEVPDRDTEGRRRRRRAGLTIHRLAGGAYRASTASAAFPGWTAAEIHAGLNETATSETTFATLRRVGAALGARDGTGPDDDPMLRWHRTAGRAAGRAAGRTEGAMATRRKMVREILRTRSIAVSDDRLVRLPRPGAVSDDEVVRAALACDDEADFEARLRAAKPLA